MKVLVTGAKGFIGKNLVVGLKNKGYNDILEYDHHTSDELLEVYCSQADFVFHLAGVNRASDSKIFMEENYGVTLKLLESLSKHKNACPIMFASSIQAKLSNPYGKSKLQVENLLTSYGKKAGSKIHLYRFPNVFGKWSKPNYNSVVATFCYNIARDIEVDIHDPMSTVYLVYIDDVVKDLCALIENSEKGDVIHHEVEPIYDIKIQDLANLLQDFKKARSTLTIPDMSDSFIKKLYSTYTSFIPENDFSYTIKMNMDSRGWFSEFLKIPDGGQISVSMTKPGFKRGNHWHHTKNEKFLVVSGEGIIKFKKVDSNLVAEYHVSGNKMKVVDVPVGYLHSIQNVGDSEMIMVMWSNEVYDVHNPDTYVAEGFL